MSEHTNAVTVFIEIHAKVGEESVARDALIHAIATSDKPGFLGSSVYEDLRDPGTFYSIQEWQDTASFQAHMGEAREGMAEATSMLRDAPRTAVLRKIA
jgi:quinol monooxygenase YgiN